MKKRLTALGLTVGLVAGGAAGLALGVPGLSSAQSGGTDSTTTTPPTTAAGGAGGSTATTPPAKPDRSKWIQDALAPLVTAGTITQAQADAVAQALQNAKPAIGPARGGAPKGFGFGRGLAGGLDTAAKAIGVTTDELRQALAGGQSIADYAKSKNVDPQKVIDALVAEAKTHLDQAVTAGKLTQAQADTELTQETTVVTNLVNGAIKLPDFSGHRDRGPKGNGSTPTPSTPSTTTG
ncbi:MAG: hypothetical protein QOD72_222 [Acidimicrobiaceae bacterium]|jgi:hypothetical protein|nr:hypothetical protein [Acidimicrobiaceae bacterium]